ncbi:ABC transporter permease subunit [Streptomyces erythrochromogenes]|uniref:ABC transporter permease n=1 Tax=Streptomyces erythrochromogenes TaxID=285574 RepID=UPI00342B152B
MPSGRFGRIAVLTASGLFFATPMAVSALSSVRRQDGTLTADAYRQAFEAPGLGSALTLSLGLAAATILLLLVLLVPAVITARLRAPRLRSLLEVMCSLPLVVPPIAFVAGLSKVLQWGSGPATGHSNLTSLFLWIQVPSYPVVLVLAYTVMALPFAYRALDSGMNALDVRTLTEAARSCGASPARALLHAVLPGLRPALLNAACLTLALVLGEFTVARLLGYQPLAVWMVAESGSQAQLSVALSVISLLFSWGLLFALALLSRPSPTEQARKTSS